MLFRGFLTLGNRCLMIETLRRTLGRGFLIHGNDGLISGSRFLTKDNFWLIPENAFRSLGGGFSILGNRGEMLGSGLG